MVGTTFGASECSQSLAKADPPPLAPLRCASSGEAAPSQGGEPIVGTTFGAYRVLAKLGEGGMGEVYRARDTRLGRDVALKVLPDSFAADRERIARFEREAQILAALSHANIAVIHGREISGPTRVLVMQLVEGEALEARLRRGPLPLDEAIAIARQIGAFGLMGGRLPGSRRERGRESQSPDAERQSPTASVSIRRPMRR